MKSISEIMKHAVLGLALVATTAFGSVTFSPTTGAGFVGKGDVQTALALNNAQMQALITAEGVKFTYVTETAYDVVYAWATGSIDNPVSLNYHEITKTTTVGVNSALAFDARFRNQYTGFNLLNLGLTTTDGTVPEVSPFTITDITYEWTTRAWTGAYEQVWDETAWTGTWTQVPCVKDPTKLCNGVKIYGKLVNGAKIYVYTTHTTDQLPGYIDPITGLPVLYTEGDDKGVIHVDVQGSVSTLKVNGVLLPITTLLP